MNRNIINKMTLVLVISFAGLLVFTPFLGTWEENESNLESSFITNTKVPNNVPSVDYISMRDLNRDVIPPDNSLVDPFVDPTNVSIDPSSQTVGPGDSFTVDIYVEPGEPIMGVAFWLSFDPSLIHADSVTEGDLFDPYNTIFNPGSIDNVAGVISNVWGIIWESGSNPTVSDPGVFCTISFTAQSSTGTSVLGLDNVQATNATGEYTTINVYNGSVTIQGNVPPVFSNENPSDGAMGVPISTSSLSVTIEDPEGDSFDWTIETSPNVGSSSGSGEGNGTKTCTISGLAYSTTYTWYVNATDTGGSGQTTSESYTFTTESVQNDPPAFSNENPPEGAIDVPITTSSLSVYISDPEGDSFDWSIETSPDVGSSGGSGEGNGTKSCSVSGLSYGTTYTWFVNASDLGGSGQTTSEVYTFTTESGVNDPPVFSNENPSDGAIDVLVSTSSLSVYISDPEGDSFDWTIETSPNIGSNSGTDESNDTKICSISSLNYGTTYTWYVNATDTGGSGQTTEEIYTFTTEEDTIPPDVKIHKPVRGLYINNKKIRPFILRIALIIGDITIEVNATDEGSGIDRVEFYIGLLGTESLGNDNTEPYTFNWTRYRLRFCHMHMLTVKAYDNIGNMATKRIFVRKIL